MSVSIIPSANSNSAAVSQSANTIQVDDIETQITYPFVTANQIDALRVKVG